MKIYQKIAALILICATAFSLCGCSLLEDLITKVPITGGTGGVTPGGTGSEETNGYSALLNYLLEDSEVNTLINRAREDGRICSSGEFDPHPYAFLQKQGHNITAIKNGELKCETQTFVKDSEPNNLYMLTYVENDASTPYYTEYLLKYELTEKEMHEYDMLHEKPRNSSADCYTQAFFINNTISKLKPVTIISKANITVQAHNGIRNGVRNYLKETNKQFVGTDGVDVMIKSFNQENASFELYVFISGSRSYAKSESSVCVYNCYGEPMKISNNIYTGPYDTAHFGLDIMLDNPIEVIDSVTTYHAQSLYSRIDFIEERNE